MAQAKKTKAGTWTILVYSHTETIDGKEKRIYERFTADKKSEVVRMAEDFKANRKGQTTSLTVREALKQYMEMKKNMLSPATLCTYQSIYNERFPIIRNIPINKLTNKDIQAEINAETMRYAYATIKTTYAVLSSILSVFCPDFQMKVNMKAKKSDEVSIPTAEEIKILINHCSSDRLALAIKIASSMGLRRGEICALKISDIDFKKQTINIHSTMVKTPERAHVIKEPKTSSSKRILPIPQFLLPDLRKMANQKNTNDFLIGLKPDNLTAHFALLVKKSEINPITFHSLRHYYASVMLCNNVPTKYAMKRMGHTTDLMLKMVYQHTMEEKENEVTKTLDNYLSNVFMQ